jgi:hypothetical protein
VNRHLDQIAWKTIHDRPKMALANAKGFRSLNYQQLGEKLAAGAPFEIVWSDFLHAFFDYKHGSFFAYPPPEILSPGWQAILAGAAEWLCEEFGLAKPDWLGDPRYTLPSPRDPWYLCQNFDAAMAEVEEPFRRRNVLFEARDLIAL